MSGREVRSRLGERLEPLGYRCVAAGAQDDTYENDQTGHRVTIVPYPRWGRRVDVLTAESMLPLPSGGYAVAFRLDVGSQVHPEGAAVPGRWSGKQVDELCERVLVPYLEQARGAAEILDMLIEGEVRPVGSAAATAVLQHGYYLAKWWQLADRVPALRETAEVLPASERVRLQHAPWGRTELAEVLWFGRDLPAAPDRLPWGPGDQGDPRAERWFRHAERQPEHADAADQVAQAHTVQGPRTV